MYVYIGSLSLISMLFDVLMVGSINYYYKFENDVSLHSGTDRKDILVWKNYKLTGAQSLSLGNFL